jgi:hypothetical protein
LPNILEAFYLYGSTSLAEFQDGYSDIDFIAVVKSKMTEKEIASLKQVHHDMQRMFPKTILDGRYIMLEDIELLDRCERTCLRFNGGEFHGYEWFDRNSVDAYQLKKYGITIKGKSIENLDYNVNWDILIDNMRVNLNTYWVKWVANCRSFLSINYIGSFVSLSKVEWGVLGVSRLYYTFREGDITSKVGAGEYVLGTVPVKWHKIINESMRLRKANTSSYYHSIIERRRDTLSYIEFIIQECNDLFNEKKL